VFDFFTGTEVSFALLYLLPIGFCTSYCGWWPGAFLSLVSALVWSSVDHLGGAVYSQPLIPIWNAFVRLGFFLITSYLLARVRFYRNHLEATVRERTAQLEREVIRRKTLEREMVELQHREQQRFAHELHDTLGSYLAGIAFRAKIVSEQLGQRNAPEFSASAELVQLINSGVAKARQFSRLLAPIACGKNDLGSALSHLAAEVESFYGITCSVSTALDLPKLTSEQAQELCRITQEAVRNAIQHAHADRIDIKMNFDENALYVTIENEGKPWEPSINWTSRGLGLRIMNHRSERIGAKLSIRKGAHSGTCVTCRLPRTETVPDGRSKGETAPQPGVDPSGKKKERDHRLPTSVRVRTA